MAEDRERVAQRLEQEDVLGRVADVVLAADDVADLHRHVVDDHGEVVERVAVRADDDEVAAEVGGVDLDPVADEVVPADDAGPDPEAQGAAAALGLASRRARPASGPRSGRGSAPAASRPPGPCGPPRAPRACSSRDRPRPSASRSAGGGRVVVQAGHLAVRARTVPPPPRRHARALVPGDAQPVEAVEDVLLERRGAAGDVRVLEAQDERAAGVPGEQVVEQRGARGADVEGPGRAGRDADADGGGHGPIVGAAIPRRRAPTAGRLSRPGAPAPGGTAPGPPRRAARG